MIRKFIQNGKLIEGSLRNRKFRDRLWVDGKLEIIKPIHLDCGMMTHLDFGWNWWTLRTEQGKYLTDSNKSKQPKRVKAVVVF
jgi:hypothetical protein